MDFQVVWNGEGYIEKLRSNREQPLLVLHIGGPKCGSSSLQTFLTRNPLLGKTGGGSKVEYWKLEADENGTLIFQPVNKSNSVDTVRGVKYENSGSLEAQLEKNCIHEIFDDFVLNNSVIENKVFVFSRERWSREFQSANLQSCKCTKKNFETIIYLHVRPQISLLSSAYLQWTLWSENPTLNAAFLEITQFADWEIQAHNAYKLGADKVLARHSKDIVADFCEVLGIDGSIAKKSINQRINSSLPLEAVALLIRNRELRRGPHDSEIDFILEELLSEMDYLPTPIRLRINSELIRESAAHFRDNNLKLLSRMTPDQAESFCVELASAEEKFLKGIGVETLAANELNSEFLEKITTLLLSDLLRNKEVSTCAVSKGQDALNAERDALNAERDERISNNPWGITKPLRKAGSIFRCSKKPPSNFGRPEERK